MIVVMPTNWAQRPTTLAGVIKAACASRIHGSVPVCQVPVYEDDEDGNPQHVGEETVPPETWFAHLAAEIEHAGRALGGVRCSVCPNHLQIAWVKSQLPLVFVAYRLSFDVVRQSIELTPISDSAREDAEATK